MVAVLALVVTACDADEVAPDLSEVGFARAVTGCVSGNASGALVLCSDPFDFDLVYKDIVPVALRDFRLVGRIRLAHASRRTTTTGRHTARQSRMQARAHACMLGAEAGPKGGRCV